MTRRKTSRVYAIGEERFAHISKEWSMKFGQNLWYVYEYEDVDKPKTLGKFPTFAEARQFVREGCRND